MKVGTKKLPNVFVQPRSGGGEENVVCWRKQNAAEDAASTTTLKTPKNISRATFVRNE